MFRAGMRETILSKADFKPYLRRSCIDDTFFLSEHRIEKIRNENPRKPKIKNAMANITVKTFMTV